MIVVVIILAVMLCIMIGFSAHQMQDLRDNVTTMEAKALVIEDLTRENEGLRRTKKDLVTSLEMVLAARDKPTDPHHPG